MVVEPNEVLLPSDGFVVLLSEGTEEVLPGNGSVLSVLLDFCLEPEFFSLPIAGDLSGSPFFSHPIVMNKINMKNCATLVGFTIVSDVFTVEIIRKV